MNCPRRNAPVRYAFSGRMGVGVHEADIFRRAFVDFGKRLCTISQIDGRRPGAGKRGRSLLAP